MRLLVLGGTSEASALARRLAARADVETVLSLAGRTTHPAPLPVPVRIGGFGGVDGLARYLRDERIEAVIDATHPFAAQMSRHAQRACEQTQVPLAVYTRPPWVAVEGDRWIEVDSAAEAAEAIGEQPRRVLLTAGRLQARAFSAERHHFVLRSIDAPPPEEMPASVELVLARGPFTLADETALMLDRRIDVVIAKNSGGDATRAKLDAARALGLTVILIRRPPSAAPTLFHDLEPTLAWLDAHAGAS